MDMLQDLSEFHSAYVDPRQLCVSIAYYGILESEPVLKKAPNLRLYLTSTQYTLEKVKAQGAGPAVSQFLEASQLTAFFKKARSGQPAGADHSGPEGQVLALAADKPWGQSVQA